METNVIENQTGELFGNLFAAFDSENYLRSVKLFKERFEDNNFDLSYFREKKCLDLGCGGGRYTIALSLLGTREAVGVDISKEGIEDARQRAKQLGIKNVSFIQNSAETLPFENETFDCVIFSGVLMHMENPEGGIAEISRVLKKGGMVYCLVYATEGVRWPLINILRNFSHQIGFDNFDVALKSSSSLDVNKRRTYLDDLFVPVIDYYSENRLKKLLIQYGFDDIDRWKKGRLDHEENLSSYFDDLNKLFQLYQAGTKLKNHFPILIENLFLAGTSICKSCIDYVSNIQQLVEKGMIDKEAARKMVIGQGHHRLTAIKK